MKRITGLWKSPAASETVVDGPAVATRRLPRKKGAGGTVVVGGAGADGGGGDMTVEFDPSTEKVRKRTVRRALRMTLDNDMEKRLESDIKVGFDEPLVRGERFISRITSFQSPYYHACIEYSLTTLHSEPFSQTMWNKIAQELQPCESALLWICIAKDILRDKRYLVHSYKDVFLGKECASFIYEYRLFHDAKTAEPKSTSVQPLSAHSKVRGGEATSLALRAQGGIEGTDTLSLRSVFQHSTAVSSAPSLQSTGGAESMTDLMSARKTRGGSVVRTTSAGLVRTPSVTAERQSELLQRAYETCQEWMNLGYLEHVEGNKKFKPDNFYRTSEARAVDHCNGWYDEKRRMKLSRGGFASPSKSRRQSESAFGSDDDLSLAGAHATAASGIGTGASSLLSADPPDFTAHRSTSKLSDYGHHPRRNLTADSMSALPKGHSQHSELGISGSFDVGSDSEVSEVPDSGAAASGHHSSAVSGSSTTTIPLSHAGKPSKLKGSRSVPSSGKGHRLHPIDSTRALDLDDHLSDDESPMSKPGRRRPRVKTPSSTSTMIPRTHSDRPLLSAADSGRSTASTSKGGMQSSRKQQSSKKYAIEIRTGDDGKKSYV